VFVAGIGAPVGWAGPVLLVSITSELLYISVRILAGKMICQFNK